MRKSYGQAPELECLAVVAHGIFNYEFLGALLSRRPEGIDAFWAYKGESGVDMSDSRDDKCWSVVMWLMTDWLDEVDHRV